MNGTNDAGWIKVHRRLLRSAIWQNPSIQRFWIWCLLKATHAPITQMVGFKKINLEPGQFVFTRPKACSETSLTEKRVRMCLETLSVGDSAEIGLTKGHNFSIVTILKWDVYQGGNEDEGRQKSDKGPAY